MGVVDRIGSKHFFRRFLGHRIGSLIVGHVAKFVRIRTVCRIRDNSAISNPLYTSNRNSFVYDNASPVCE